MNTIYKYYVPATSGTIFLPAESKLIHVGEQDGAICLWLEVPENSYKKYFGYACYATGSEVEEGMRHVQTVLMKSGLVWHFYLEEGF